MEKVSGRIDVTASVVTTLCILVVPCKGQLQDQILLQLVDRSILGMAKCIFTLWNVYFLDASQILSAVVL